MYKFIFCLLTSATLFSTEVDLDTGRWYSLIDTSRAVDLDKTVYKTRVGGINQIESQVMLHTVDGWWLRVAEPSPETLSFYESPPENFKQEVVDLWSDTDQIQFHKTVNRSTLLCYNIDKELMIDVELIKVEPNEKTLFVKGVHENEIWLSDLTLWYSSTQKLQEQNAVLLVNNHPWKWGDNSPAIAIFAPRVKKKDDQRWQPSIDLSRTDGLHPLKDALEY